MKTQTTKWKRVSKQHPCPVCQKSDWCMVTDDAVLCMRVESQKPAKSGGWIHPLNETAAASWDRVPVQKKQERTDQELDAIWRPRAERWREQGRGEVGRLAVILGVNVAALGELGAGWEGRSWTFPERNAAGLILGVSRRFEDGTKRCAVGSRRGLTYSDGWIERDGPVLIVEGASDTAAGITLGLAVIGRPSNVGGLKLLVKLFVSVKRTVIVLGERDRKPHESLPAILRRDHDPRCRGCPKCWPGCFGARKLAACLNRALSGKVLVRMLPDEVKDLRAWLNARQIDVGNPEACWMAGKDLLCQI